jgi:hypothetical protein
MNFRSLCCKDKAIKAFGLIGLTLLLTILSVSSLFAYYAYTENEITEFICIVSFTVIGMFCMILPMCRTCKTKSNNEEEYEYFTITDGNLETIEEEF